MDGSNPRVESVLVFCEARIGELGAIAFVNIHTRYCYGYGWFQRSTSVGRGMAELPKDMGDQ